LRADAGREGRLHARTDTKGGQAVPEAGAPILTIRGLHKRFGDVEALVDVGLELTPGEVVFLIGPSGSGKSTLLRCINRLAEPTSGEIVVDGVDITRPHVDLNEVRRGIGFVFQSFNLYPHMTALGNVTFALRHVLRMSKASAEQRGRAMLEDVGLGHKCGARPSELSGGQQQRVGIARALAMQPKLLLLDEPTSALDPELVEEVLATIGKLRERGMTMIIASHEMYFAREAADRVVFMAEGRIVEQGPPGMIFDSPTHARTREFLNRFLRPGAARARRES
jgi:polar amino acid transport system ATP-binding protein